MKHFSFFLLLSFFLQFSVLKAQVKTEFNNNSKITDIGKFSKSYKARIDYTVPAKNIADLQEAEKKEAVRSNETKPFQLAVPVPVDLDIAKFISWVYEGDFAYGKYTLKLDSALSASINFDKFFLPKGTEMYVYNENGNMITGPVTDNENNGSKVWGSWVYKGCYLTIEIKIPAASINELLLHSDNVAYGYKEIYKAVGFGNSGACQINVLCPLGNGWEPERNAVALILSENGEYWCSGSIVMNSCNTRRPFFLTANHCYATNPIQDVTKWRFNFQDWSPTCNPSQNNTGVTYNGSTLRANWGNSDFCLVELVNMPPANSGINYAGWTRSATPAQNATGIHHPRGDVMKISRGNNPVTIASAFGTNNQHWRVDWSPQNNGAGQIVTAVTEGGSSGSPLFDQNHRIIGQLHGGPSVCGGTQLWDFYGRFDLSWTGGGTNSTRLSNWLDPGNTGTLTTNTTNVASLTNASLSLSIAGNNSFCTGTSSYTVNGVPAGAGVTWTSSNTSIATVTPSGNPGTVTKTGNGIVTITATVGTGCYFNNVLSKTVTVGIVPSPSVDANWDTPLKIIAFVDPVDGATSYKWYVNNVYIKSTSNNTTSLPYYGDCNTNVTVSAEVVNSCGTSGKTSTNIGTAPCGSFYSIAPNPAGDIVTITADAPSALAVKTGVSYLSESRITQVKIYNSNGVLLKTIPYTKAATQVKINVGDLETGLYFVEVSNGIIKQTQKIVIAR